MAIISDLGFKTQSCDIRARADCIVVVVVADRAIAGVGVVLGDAVP